MIDRRTPDGFLESSLQRFVTAHRTPQVERGTRFRQLTEAEREEIIRRARRMALVPPRAGRPGRDRAKNRTKDVTLYRNNPTDFEGS